MRIILLFGGYVFLPVCLIKAQTIVILHTAHVPCKRSVHLHPLKDYFQTSNKTKRELLTVSKLPLNVPILHLAQEDEYGMTLITTFITRYVAALLLFSANCIADNPPRAAHQSKVGNNFLPVVVYSILLLLLLLLLL